MRTPQLSPGWHSLGGQVSGPPAVVALPDDEEIPAVGPSVPASPWFIATGVNKDLYIRSLTVGWQKIPAQCLGSPAAWITTRSDGQDTLTVACEGTSHKLDYQTAGVSGPEMPVFLNGWSDLGGTLTAGPAIAPVGGVLTFFVRGPNGRIYTRTLKSGYIERAWACNGPPAATMQATTQTTVFACQGTSHQLLEASNDNGAAWTPAASLGGTLIGAPAVAVTSETTDFFGEGADHSVFERTTAAGWTSLGGAAAGGTGAAALS